MATFRKAKKQVGKQIRVMLQGGLGNQLFQFAFGCQMAVNTNQSIVFDGSAFKFDKKRFFELENFGILEGIPYSIKLGKDSLEISPSNGNPPEATHNLNEIIEENYFFNTLSKAHNGDSQYYGYWQSPLYFADIDSMLVKYLRGFLDIKPHDFTMVHVRRGDFTQKSILDEHGLLEVKYYLRALSLIRGPSPIMLVSDDMSGAKESVGRKLENCYEITYDNSINALNTLSIMASAQKIVLANSTFSWWGAYLSAANQVIAPRAFFSKNGLRKRNICDLYPDGWILV
jgi:hypothetical protein